MPEQKQDSISLRELVRIAAKAYNNEEDLHGSESAWDHVIDGNGRLVARGKLGDTLADFIMIELADTYDPKAGRADQIEVAVGVMESASDQLARVNAAFFAIE
jgi:hypothetical protein